VVRLVEVLGVLQIPVLLDLDQLVSVRAGQVARKVAQLREVRVAPAVLDYAGQRVAIRYAQLSVAGNVVAGFGSDVVRDVAVRVRDVVV
jgi:hypothetical protein